MLPAGLKEWELPLLKACTRQRFSIGGQLYFDLGVHSKIALLRRGAPYGIRDRVYGRFSNGVIGNSGQLPWDYPLEKKIFSRRHKGSRYSYGARDL